jgi:23S rRNA pseudoU1915 N3-methylase RlmH
MKLPKFISEKAHNDIMNRMHEEYKKEFRRYLDRIGELTQCPEGEWSRQMDEIKKELKKENSRLLSRLESEKEDLRVLQLKYDEVYKVLSTRNNN